MAALLCSQTITQYSVLSTGILCSYILCSFILSKLLLAKYMGDTQRGPKERKAVDLTLLQSIDSTRSFQASLRVWAF